MLNIQVSESDWTTVVKYWHDLKQHLSQSHDKNKVDFLNRIIFESAGLTAFNSQYSTIRGVTTTIVAPADVKDKTKIPSIGTMSEIMNEIDNELEFENTDRKVNDSQTIEIKIDEKIKPFISEPV